MRRQIRFAGILAGLCSSVLVYSVDVLGQQGASSTPRVATPGGMSQHVPSQAVPNDQAAPPVPAVAPRLSFAADFRLRYESNVADADRRNHDRVAIRGRARAIYNASRRLAVGAQIATGDADDPNSADVTLSNFDDDLEVSLDQLYARVNFGELQVSAGKIPQPLIRTDLLWDSDVSPQGVSAMYTAPFAGPGSLKTTALYFIVDESLTGRNSDMAGIQLALSYPVSTAWRYEFAAGYYDYSLRSLLGADAGDLRSNGIDATGNYVSDFNLLNVISTLTYQRPGTRWLMRATGDYVRNFGSAPPADSAYGADVLVGRLIRMNDWRCGYGYAVADTDAVLAAFSHDNTTIATNYRQHSAVLDYQLSSSIVFNTTLYRYRPKHVGESRPENTDP